MRRQIRQPIPDRRSSFRVWRKSPKYSPAIELFEGKYVVAKFASLGRAPGRIVLGIEVNRNPFVPVIFKRMKLAVLVSEFESRRWVSFPDFLGEHGSAPCKKEGGDYKACQNTIHGERPHQIRHYNTPRVFLINKNDKSLRM